MSSSACKVPPESQATSEALAEEMLEEWPRDACRTQFRQGKADMPLDAEKILAEVAALLVRQPAGRYGSKRTAARQPTSRRMRRCRRSAHPLSRHGC